MVDMIKGCVFCLGTHPFPFTDRHAEKVCRQCSAQAAQFQYCFTLVQDAVWDFAAETLWTYELEVSFGFIKSRKK